MRPSSIYEGVGTDDEEDGQRRCLSHRARPRQGQDDTRARVRTEREGFQDIVAAAVDAYQGEAHDAVKDLRSKDCRSEELHGCDWVCHTVTMAAMPYLLVTNSGQGLKS